MDLVKLSVAGGMAFMAALMLVATGAQGRAESRAAELHPALPADSVQARIDSAFDTSRPMPKFGLDGPLFPLGGGVPMLPAQPPAATAWPPNAPAVGDWSVYIDEAARRFGVPPAWVRGVMHQESGGRTHLNGRPITSHAGAMGLMQVMPGTFAELSARYGLGNDPYEPRANIHAGAAYLREMHDRFGWRYFLAAYNAGPVRVEAHLRRGVPLPLETQIYTATLLPRLFPGATPPPVTPSIAAAAPINAAPILVSTSSPFRSAPRPVPSTTAASVFASADAPRPASSAQVERPDGDGLFVSLSAVDRRRDAATDAPRAD